MPPIPGRKPNWPKISKTVDEATARHNDSLKPVRLSLLQEHRVRWAGGCGAEICSGATRVICRGTVPCDVLLIGEAPGESENALGKPFIGPAGKLLDRIVRDALAPVPLCATCGLVRRNDLGADWICNQGHARRDGHGGRDVTTAFTNLVCCIPREADGDKAAAPNDEDVECCRPRLEEFVRIASPRLVVAVGSLARDYLDPKLKGHVELPEGVRTVAIKHPAAILRSPTASQGLDVQRCVVQIRDAVLDVFGG